MTVVKRRRRIRCRHCKELFMPDARNRGRQRYCSKDECRKASKHASQQKWLSKRRNWDYFRGSANTERVRLWREGHPNYWRRHRRKAPVAPPLQEPGLSPVRVHDERRLQLTFTALQDSVLRIKLQFVGWVSRILGNIAQKESLDCEMEASYLRGKAICGV